MRKNKIFILIFVSFLCLILTNNANSEIFINSRNKKIQNVRTIFYDDFNDNEKDFNKWSEIFSNGDWWERNGQAEFRLHEASPSWLSEGIETIGITVTTQNEPLIIECIIDTFVDNYPDPYSQWVGQTHLRIVDSENPNNSFIDLYYSRGNDEIILEDTMGTSISLGSTDEFRSKAIITIEKDRYQVELGPYVSGWIANAIFPTKFTVKIQIYIILAGDYPDYWWSAAFDDVGMQGRKTNNDNQFQNIENISLITEIKKCFPSLKSMISTIIKNRFN